MKTFSASTWISLFLGAALPATAADILKNGGFEQNDGVTFTADFNVDTAPESVLIQQGETHLTGVEVATDPSRGLYYISDPLNTNNPQGEHFVWLSGAPFDCVQFDLVNSGINVPLVNGATYEVSFWAAAFDVTMDGSYVPQAIPVQTDSPFAIELQRADFSHNVLDVVAAPASASYGNMNWIPYAYQFVYNSASPDTNYVNLILSSQGDNEGIAFDGVQLNVVPEPGVVGAFLLGVAGLALLRRREA